MMPQPLPPAQSPPRPRRCSPAASRLFHHPSLTRVILKVHPQCSSDGSIIILSNRLPPDVFDVIATYSSLDDLVFAWHKRANACKRRFAACIVPVMNVVKTSLAMTLANPWNARNVLRQFLLLVVLVLLSIIVPSTIPCVTRATHLAVSAIACRTITRLQLAPTAVRYPCKRANPAMMSFVGIVQ
jgi:hypothetical protein